MHKVKTLLMTIFVLALSILMAGCGMLFSRDAEPEETETVSEEGEMPEWLLLSHRTASDADDDEEIAKPKDPEDEETDEEDSITETTTEEEATAEEPVQTEPATTEQGTADHEAVADGEAAAQEEVQDNDEPKPGTMDYIIQKRKEEQALKEEQEAEREAEAAAEEEDSTTWYD